MAARQRRFLVLASEWFSKRGGLSTLNRSLCRALARAQYETTCLVAKASQEEIDDAREAGVRLVVPKGATIAGLSDEAAVCLPAEVGDIDVVIGHGHITGAAAAARIAAFHPNARRIHIFHTTPDELEWLKGNPAAASRAEEKQRVQAQLATTSTFSLSVGPRLARQWSTHLASENSPQHVYRLDPGPDQASRVTDGPPPELQCLLLGRAEDKQIKGIDIAARALGHLRANDPFFEGPYEPVLVVRGAQAGSEVELRATLQSAAGTGLSVNVKAYTEGVDEVRKDILRASVVLMPSRAEGFGLVALEALEHGVPVLVSSRSGFAELLRERADADRVDAFALEFIVDVKDDETRDREAWSLALARLLKDRRAAFEKAARLRSRLLEARYWERTVAQIIGQLDLVDAPPPPPGGRWAERDPAASIEQTTETLADEVSRFAASRGVFGALTGLVEQLVAKGNLSKKAAEQLSELFHRRNVAVHTLGSGLGKVDAILHAQRVELALERLRTHSDREPLDAIFAEVAADANALIRHLRPELHEIARKMPLAARGGAVVIVADIIEPTARRVAESILKRRGLSLDMAGEPIFYAAQPVETILEVLKEAGMDPLPPSIVQPPPPERTGAIRILVLMKNGLQVEWWTPPTEMSAM